MTTTSTGDDAREVAQLRDALAFAKAQLEEVRGELGRLVRITERELAQKEAEVESATSLKIAMEHRIQNNKKAVLAFIELIRESKLLPPEVIISWLVRSELFDPDYYLRANEDVAAADADPGDHFISHGLQERRNFNEAFAT